VWEITLTKNPYDADLLSLGEEPRGPSMTEYGDRFDGVEAETSERRQLVGQMRNAAALLHWVVPWNVDASDVLLLVTAGFLGVFWTGFELSVRMRRRVGTLPLQVPVGRGVIAPVGIPVSGWLFLSPGVDRYAAPVWQGVAVVVLGASLLSIPDRVLDRGASSRFRRGVRDNWALTVGALGVTASLVLAAMTPLNAFFLAAAAFFALVGYRHVRTGGLGARGRSGYVAVGYLLRVGTIVPVLALVYVSQKSPLTGVYLGLAALLFGSMALPHVEEGSPVPRPGGDALGPVVSGWRAVAFAVVVLAIAGLSYSVTRPTTLTGAYVGLCIVLVREAVLIVRA
jgi:hypothetical protein